MHIQPQFLGSSSADTPELQAIIALLERSKLGIAFGESKEKK
ncbi:MAG: hypothetical protein R2822_13620 [Spirosomataceae bacterium]